NRQRQLIYNYRNKLLSANDLTKIIKKKTKKTKGEIIPIEPEYLKARLVKEIDNFWSEYLESLNKIRTLVNVKYYLPQEPQEAFFWETIDLFHQGFRQ